MLIVGSFVPFIYYGFYCRTLPMVIYTSMIIILGVAALIVSLWDKFAEPKFRPVRATVFVAMGLSSRFLVEKKAFFNLLGIVPTIHLLITGMF